MGTNYHWAKNKVAEGEVPETDLHIGKNSWGWVFHFQAYPRQNLTTVEAWKEKTKEGYIYDEYDRLISYNDFWDIVYETLEPMPDGSPKYVLYDPEEQPAFIPDLGEWTDSGFAFMNSDFC